MRIYDCDGRGKGLLGWEFVIWYTAGVWESERKDTYTEDGTEGVQKGG